MAGLKIAAFAGIAPKKGPNLLQDNEAQIAENCKLYSGELRAWNNLGALPYSANIRANSLSIYKHTKTNGDPLWLSWTTDVNVVPGPIYATGENPIYYTGDGTPRKTNSTLSQSGAGPYYPGDYLEMGVPTPSATLTATPSSTTGTTETRNYVFTYLSYFGTIEEESAPSPASNTITTTVGSSVTVSGFPTSAPAGKYNITKIRLYRAVTGSASTVYLKVADFLIGPASYTDTVAASGLGIVMDSELNDPPPSDLQGITSMANGILAGFRGSEVYFSRAFLPHAWPAAYALTVEFPIVGMAAFGSSLLVATKGNPFIISGTDPGSMSQEKLPLYEPCVSKRSVAGDEGGVLYASPNGIVRVAPGFAGVSTKNLFARDEWQQFSPDTMLGVVFDGRYYAFYTADSGFRYGLILDKNDQASPLTTTSMSTNAVHVEPSSAGLFVAEGEFVRIWEGNPNAFLEYQWKSKVFILPRPLNFAAAQISADFADAEQTAALQAQIQAIETANQAIWAANSNLRSTVSQTGPLNSGPLLESVMTPVPSAEIDNRFVLMTVWANGSQVHQVSVQNTNPFRLPSGFRAERWEIGLSGNVPLRQVKLAESGKGLEAV